MCFYNYINYRASALKELLPLALLVYIFLCRLSSKWDATARTDITILGSLDRN